MKVMHQCCGSGRFFLDTIFSYCLGPGPDPSQEDIFWPKSGLYTFCKSGSGFKRPDPDLVGLRLTLTGTVKKVYSTG
jgi:hypothetical protein